jgi:hypothetical protein
MFLKAVEVAESRVNISKLEDRGRSLCKKLEIMS